MNERMKHDLVTIRTSRVVNKLAGTEVWKAGLDFGPNTIRITNESFFIPFIFSG